MAFLPVDPAVPGQLQARLDTAVPGDVIVLLAGCHRETAVMRHGGRIGAPITIVARKGAVIRGPMIEAGTDLYVAGTDGLPNRATWAFLRVLGCGHVSFVGLDIASCWPCAVYAEDAWDLLFEDCVVRGGSYPFFLRDTQPKSPRARGVIVRGCHWVQDESIWHALPWKKVHDDDEPYFHFNGALLGTADILGDIVFERNVVEDAFNAIRIDITRHIREVFPEELPRRNRNIFVFDNVFRRIRDNVVEPETHALNLHFHHNEVMDAHAPLSLDGVGGGYWYIYGNRFWFQSRQGLPGQSQRGGKIFKLAGYPNHPTFPWYVFNNSIYCRSNVFGNGDSGEVPFKHLAFFDNAIEACRRACHADGPGDILCDGVKEAIIPTFRIGPETFFDQTLSNIDSWFDTLGCNEAGDGFTHPFRLPPSQGIFVEPHRGDLTLASTAPGRGEGKRRTIRMGDGESFLWEAGRDIGAVQSAGALPRLPMRSIS